eukprot:15049-Heterococcus_DN1.PRE.1
MQHYHYRVNRAEANCSTETIAQHRTCCDSCTAQNSHAQKLTAVTAAEQQPKRQWQTACCSCEPASNTAAAADSVAIARVESTNNCRFVIQTVATVPETNERHTSFQLLFYSFYCFEYMR